MIRGLTFRAHSSKPLPALSAPLSFRVESDKAQKTLILWYILTSLAYLTVHSSYERKSRPRSRILLNTKSERSITAILRTAFLNPNMALVLICPVASRPSLSDVRPGHRDVTLLRFFFGHQLRCHPGMDHCEAAVPSLHTIPSNDVRITTLVVRIRSCFKSSYVSTRLCHHPEHEFDMHSS